MLAPGDYASMLGITTDSDQVTFAVQKGGSRVYVTSGDQLSFKIKTFLLYRRHQ